MKLNGWSRLGVVLSVMWVAAVLSLVLVEYFRIDKERQENCALPPAPKGFVVDVKTTPLFFRWEPVDLLGKDSGAYVRDFGIRTGRVLAVTLLPILGVWIGVCLVVAAVRWIKAGFIGTRSRCSGPWFVYLGLLVVFSLSVAASLELPSEGLVREAALVPGVAALVGAVWQVFREDAAHKRELELKQREQFFRLSVTSHMAQVAFDKHAAFCEEYIGRVQRGIQELYRDGPSKNAASIAVELSEIRQKHAPWVPPDVLERLKPFERAIWDIGISAGYLSDAGPSSDRAITVKQMHKTFAQVLGIPFDDTEERADIRVDQILGQLQDALGIRELSLLRVSVVKEAMRALTE